MDTEGCLYLELIGSGHIVRSLIAQCPHGPGHLTDLREEGAIGGYAVDPLALHAPAPGAGQVGRVDVLPDLGGGGVDIRGDGGHAGSPPATGSLPGFAESTGGLGKGKVIAGLVLVIAVTLVGKAVSAGGGGAAHGDLLVHGGRVDDSGWLTEDTRGLPGQNHTARQL